VTSSSFTGSPTTLEVYLVDRGPYALSLAGVRPLADPQCTGLTPKSVSGDGTRVVMVCFGWSPVPPSVITETIVFDVVTGAIVKRLPGGGPDPVLSHDGSVIFHVVPYSLVRTDVASGVSSSVPLQIDSHRAFVDPRSSHVFVVGDDGVAAYDPDSLQLLRSRDRSGAPPHWGVAFDPDRPWLYVLDFSGPNLIRTTVKIIDTDTLQTVAAGDLPSDAYPRGIAVSSAPRPPSSMTAVVQANTVQLAWTPGGAPASVTRYVLEAGSGPGLSDIVAALDVGLQTALSASGVPPGRYYVRVRAGNYSGLSAPSNEVVVTVP
jgi:hypothetical protein